MKAKLVKEKDGKFHLWLNVGTKDADHIASNEPLVGEWGRNLLKYKLSLKNCQVIECGYDLDELANEYSEGKSSKEVFKIAHEKDFKAGFQKCLELIGDKKFSEEDIRKTIELSREIHQEGRPYLERDEYDYTSEQIIQSLQQTEWDVEVEMICPHPSDTYRCGIQYGCDEDGCNHPNQVPYLDADGCLILKRI